MRDSFPGLLLKDVGLPEFNWSPELGVPFQHLWKGARCSVSVVSRLWLGLGSDRAGVFLFYDPSGDTRQEA